jgi:prepilin-type N-terminal cleavage/methylation domain-containing protein
MMLRRAARAKSERGVVLLEVLVALVVLSLVGLAYLQLFHQAHSLAASSRDWLAAVEYAEDGLEDAKAGNHSPDTAVPSVPTGISRRITRRPWREGLELVTVTVSLPSGVRFELQRLARPSGVRDGRWFEERW